jgi:hypothetical protein
LPKSKIQIFLVFFDTSTHFGHRELVPGPLTLFMTLICTEIFTINAIKIKNNFEKIVRAFRTSTLVQRPRFFLILFFILIFLRLWPSRTSLKSPLWRPTLCLATPSRRMKFGSH